MNRKYLGIDIGTTSLKAAVFDESGNRLALRSVDYTLDTASDSGFIEFDADEYISMCREVIDSLCNECGKPDALSVDTQGETMIFADADGKPLAPAIVWLDNRASDQADEIKRAFGCERVYNVTGQPEITAGWPACKMLWIKRNRPGVWQRTKKVFLLEDWVLYSLTGNFVTEPTIQSSSVYFDITKLTWWREMLDFIGVGSDILPHIEKTGTVVGEYNGIRVVTGALDQISGTLGVGAVDSNRISEMTGTIMAVCSTTSTVPPYNPDSIIPCHIHAIPNSYCRILWSSTAGMALKWFKNNFAEQYGFKELDAMAGEVPSGCDGLSMLPYFCGSSMPRYNPDARAVFSGVTLSHTRGHFARSILEAVAFMLRQDIEYIGIGSVDEIRITGGGASGTLWPQIKADVTGKRLVTVCESETACLGSAMIAAVGIGDFDSFGSASARLVKTGRSFIPSENDYSEAYDRFVALDGAMNDLTFRRKTNV